ncbi:MAG: signal peptidase II [Dehalococcoidia bacterium]|nr:signal peptidase II [Dehalococcoidia bacterium]
MILREKGLTKKGRRRLLYLSLGLAAFVILADQITKLLVRSRIAAWASVPEEGAFRLTHVQNSGSAFGLFPSQTVILAIASLVAIVGLVMALRYQPLRNGWANAALGLLLGGSIGNLVDRLRLGYVTDFIDIGQPHGWRFYTFNIADSAITVGSILMAITILLLGRHATQEATPPETPPDPVEGK